MKGFASGRGPHSSAWSRIRPTATRCRLRYSQWSRMLPLPNGGRTGDPRIGFYNLGTSGFLDEDSVFARVDYNLSDKDRLSTRYNANKSLTKAVFRRGQGTNRARPGAAPERENHCKPTPSAPPC